MNQPRAASSSSVLVAKARPKSDDLVLTRRGYEVEFELVRGSDTAPRRGNAEVILQTRAREKGV